MSACVSACLFFAGLPIESGKLASTVTVSKILSKFWQLPNFLSKFCQNFVKIWAATRPKISGPGEYTPGMAAPIPVAEAAAASIGDTSSSGLAPPSAVASEVAVAKAVPDSELQQAEYSEGAREARNRVRSSLAWWLGETTAMLNPAYKKP